MAWIDDLFKRMVELEASDLHMTSGEVPKFRLHGEIVDVPGAPTLTAEQLGPIFDEITPEANKQEFESDGDTDYAYEIAGLARFRCNRFMDRLGPGAVFRFIPAEILTAEQLGLPRAVIDLCHLSKGLVVVTGPTGSGKSTTLAAMIDYINKNRSDHIITIEDPVEFVHPQQRCLINQREVHRHTQSFKRALRAALREDPDIVLVGEMRDLETVEIAIETAETGHLVFGTLHTTTAASTVDRIIDQFSADRQSQIRTMLSASLKGVIAQTLCKKQPKGRVAALEILIANTAVAANIREGKTHQITTAMQMGGKIGMRLLNDSLKQLVGDGLVEPAEAYVKSVDKPDMENKLSQLGIQFDPSSLAEGVASDGGAATAAAQQQAEAPLPRTAAPQAQPAPAPAPAPGAAPRGGYADPFDQFRKGR
jgi:twitching motility protein PilT